MISVILTIHNRAHLLQWCLEAICRNSFPSKLIELNVLDDGSTDGLDSLLQQSKKHFHSIRYTVWDRTKLEVPILFNCPAQAYNRLIKEASFDIIYKTDPEMVILDPNFINKAIIALENPNAIIMPFPYHCYEFPIVTFEDIKNNYLDYCYPTHITKENAKHTMVYYQAIFNKKSYLDLGGVDERFSASIGSEDDHFLGWWKKEYGWDSFIALLDSPAVHLYHGGMASGPGGVPIDLYPWVQKGADLKKQLENSRPNNHRIY